LRAIRSAPHAGVLARERPSYTLRMVRMTSCQTDGDFLFVGSPLAGDLVVPISRNRGYSALRKGRYSVPGATYFLTICLNSHQTGLALPTVGKAVLRESHTMAHDGVWQLRVCTLMPDHSHWLVTLGDQLALSQCVGRLKAKTKDTLRAVGVAWQENYFDHSINTNEPSLPVFLYIYLNPYRAQLIERSAPWPWFYCRPDEWAWFKDYLDNDLPPPGWLV